MRAATEGSLPLVMPQGNLVEVLGREVRQGSTGELMVESSPSRQRRPPCKTNKEMSDEAADAAALTYLLTWEWVVLQRLSDIEIRQMAVFTDFIPLHFCRFFTDLFPLNVDVVNFSISNASVLFFI